MPRSDAAPRQQQDQQGPADTERGRSPDPSPPSRPLDPAQQHSSAGAAIERATAVLGNDEAPEGDR